MRKKVSFLIVATLCLSGCFATKEKPTTRDYLQKGITLEQQGVYGEAIKVYSQALELDENNAEAYFRRGKAYRVSFPSESREALADLNKSVDLDPTNAEAYYERGLLNAFTIRNEAAREDRRTAASLGHGGARQWFAGGEKEKPKEQAEEKKAVAVADRTQRAPAAGEAETAARGAETAAAGTSMPTGLRENLPSGREPMIHFDVNMATIGEASAALLDEIAAALKEKLPGAKIVVAGHTDNTGTDRYNEALSLRRARAVQMYLEERHGVSPDRISVKGYGKNAPLSANDTEEGRAKNRRVEILLGTEK